MPTKLPLAAQLYTLRDLTRHDFPGTLHRLREIGYTAVELAGYGNLPSAKQAKRACDDAGLTICAAHTSLDSLEQNPAAVLDEFDTLGTTNVVVSYMPEPRRRDANGWRHAAETMDRIGADLRAQGFTLAYHNHSFEFHLFSDEGPHRSGMDIFWDHTHPDHVKAELDVYWLRHGGQDPTEYITRLRDRALLLHLKDMGAAEDRPFAEVGQGILDFHAITEAARSAGTQWYIVEQDQTYHTPPLEALRTSYLNLQNLGLI